MKAIDFSRYDANAANHVPSAPPSEPSPPWRGPAAELHARLGDDLRVADGGPQTIATLRKDVLEAIGSRCLWPSTLPAVPAVRRLVVALADVIEGEIDRAPLATALGRDQIIDQVLSLIHVVPAATLQPAAPRRAPRRTKNASHTVRRAFQAGADELVPGDTVNAAEWPNRTKLVSTGYLEVSL